MDVHEIIQYRGRLGSRLRKIQSSVSDEEMTSSQEAELLRASNLLSAATVDTQSLESEIGAAQNNLNIALGIIAQFEIDLSIRD